MCNPRRVRISATQDLCESWEHEVARTVQLAGRVVGEARIRQSLRDELGEPALRALELVMGAGGSGWVETPEGFRFDVEGGHVLYLIDEQALEIVASLEDQVSVIGHESQTLVGKMAEQIAAEGEGHYYDDDWGGHTERNARSKAEAEAQRKLKEAASERIRQAQNNAEAGASAEIESRARQKAEEELRRAEAQRQLELAAQARGRLTEVGMRGRQAFHNVLATAYRDAILAYARRNGGEGIQCVEDGDTINIEFHVER